MMEKDLISLNKFIKKFRNFFSYYYFEPIKNNFFRSKKKLKKNQK